MNTKAARESNEEQRAARYPRMTQREYIQQGGSRCPICRSFAVEPSTRFDEGEDGGVSRLVRCAECGKEWREVYALKRWE